MSQMNVRKMLKLFNMLLKIARMMRTRRIWPLRNRMRGYRF